VTYRYPASPGGLPLADFGTRFVAYLIDAALLLAATLAVTVPAGLIFFVAAVRPAIDSADASGHASPAVVGAVVLGAVLLALGLVAFTLGAQYVYTVELMWRSGQTVGKRVMSLRVIPLDPRLRLTRGIATRRWAVQSVVGTVVPFFQYLDGLWQLWDRPFRQTLHDKAAQTVVVKVSA
jgi:uncharacterized RDD family membrane protein YckC